MHGDFSSLFLTQICYLEDLCALCIDWKTRHIYFLHEEDQDNWNETLDFIM